MQYKFIFYGSLMDVSLVHKICGHKPVSIEIGAFKGKLYAVTDHSEPHDVFRYPLAVLTDCGPRVKSLLNWFDMTTDEFTGMRERLCEFEGPLYELTTAPFYTQEGVQKEGFIFAARKGFRPEEHHNIREMPLVEGGYVWR